MLKKIETILPLLSILMVLGAVNAQAMESETVWKRAQNTHLPHVYLGTINNLTNSTLTVWEITNREGFYQQSRPSRKIGSFYFQANENLKVVAQIPAHSSQIVNQDLPFWTNNSDNNAARALFIIERSHATGKDVWAVAKAAASGAWMEDTVLSSKYAEVSVEISKNKLNGGTLKASAFMQPERPDFYKGPQISKSFSTNNTEYLNVTIAKDDFSNITLKFTSEPKDTL